MTETRGGRERERRDIVSVVVVEAFQREVFVLFS
jgi:hypothetical protein